MAADDPEHGGHTHTPAIFCLDAIDGEGDCEQREPAVGKPIALEGERLVVNPGSVGQPRDGDPRASYLILDWNELTIEHRRVEYPVEATQAKMMQHDLPLRLVLRLGYGW